PTLRGALSKFRATGTVPDDLALKCFTQRWAHRLEQLGIALTSVPLDRPRLGGLLLRLLLFTVAFAVPGHLAAILWVTGKRVLELGLRLGWAVLGGGALVLLGVFLLIWVFLAALGFWHFGTSELRIFFVSRAAFRRMYARIYSRVSRLIPLPPEEAAARLDHPW